MRENGNTQVRRLKHDSKMRLPEIPFHRIKQRGYHTRLQKSLNAKKNDRKRCAQTEGEVAKRQPYIVVVIKRAQREGYYIVTFMYARRALYYTNTTRYRAVHRYTLIYTQYSHNDEMLRVAQRYFTHARKGENCSTKISWSPPIIWRPSQSRTANRYDTRRLPHKRVWFAASVM